MRPTASIVFLIFILTSCSSKGQETVSHHKTQDRDIECDSLKFPDFKNNLQEIGLRTTKDFNQEIDKIAKEFTDEECKGDTFLCDVYYLKNRQYYRSTFGYDLFAFGYAYENSDSAMENESVSFFVFGIKQSGKIIFYDIASDLVGEIQLELSGLELKNGTIIIWGEMYPYFSDDYGKFKLTINGQETNYQFQCKSH